MELVFPIPQPLVLRVSTAPYTWSESHTDDAWASLNGVIMFATEQPPIAQFSCRPNTGKETRWLTPSSQGRRGARFQL